MDNFTFYSPTYFVFGRGEENHTGKYVKRFGGSKVLIHYGGGSVVRSGLLDRVKASLEQENISYVELDGDVCKNIDAFESVIRCMKEAGIGYGSVNHPVDRDPVCGYNGIIDDVCPRCGRHAGEGVPLEKLEELRKKYHDVPDYSCLIR